MPAASPSLLRVQCRYCQPWALNVAQPVAGQLHMEQEVAMTQPEGVK